MNDEPINNQIKSSMDAATDAIDVSTQIKLNEARHSAIHQQKKLNLKFWHWSLLGTTVAMVLTVTFLINRPEVINTNNENFMLFEDLEMLANEESTEFYQDLEFFAWLEQSEWADSEI